MHELGEMSSINEPGLGYLSSWITNYYEANWSNAQPHNDASGKLELKFTTFQVNYLIKMIDCNLEHRRRDCRRRLEGVRNKKDSDIHMKLA